jgi:hypothetical protein
VRKGIAGSDRDVPQEVRRFMNETRAYAPPLQRRDGSVVDYYGQRMQYLQHILG